MAGENAYIDENSRNTITALANDASGDIYNVRINPITGALVVEGNVTSGNTSIGSTIPGGTAGSVLFLDIGSTLGEDNPYFFYDPVAHQLAIGHDSPTATLDVHGTFKYVDGNEAAGYVMTSDGSGNASWSDTASLGFVTQIVAGTDIDISPIGGTGVVTINVDTAALAGDSAFIDALIANAYFTNSLATSTDFIDDLIANTYFTSSLANDTTFITDLASNSTFISALSGTVAVVTDGVTITGDGTAGDPLVAVTGGTGTVTSVSVVTANGVSGSVATATTTPAITLTLGAITPSTVNGLTFTALATGFTVAGGTASRTLTVPANASVSGTNTGDQTITLTGDVTGTGTGSFATTIANNVVTYAKMQAVSTTSKLLGSSSTTTPVQEITLGTGLSMSGTTLNATGGSGSGALLRLRAPIQTVPTSGQEFSVGCDVSQSSPDYWYMLLVTSGTTLVAYRFDKQSSGNYVYKGINSGAISVTSNATSFGIIETNGFVYAWYRSAPATGTLTRFTTALASPTAITGFTTSLNASNSMVSDVSTPGTIWIKDTNNDTIKEYTISGTVATLANTITTTTSSNSETSLYNDGTTFFVFDDIKSSLAPANLIRTYDSAGTGTGDINTCLYSATTTSDYGLDFLKLNGYLAYAYVYNGYVEVQTLDLP